MLIHNSYVHRINFAGVSSSSSSSSNLGHHSFKTLSRFSRKSHRDQHQIVTRLPFIKKYIFHRPLKAIMLAYTFTYRVKIELFFGATETELFCGQHFSGSADVITEWGSVSLGFDEIRWKNIAFSSRCLVEMWTLLFWTPSTWCY